MEQFKVGDKVKDKGTRQLYDGMGFQGKLILTATVYNSIVSPKLRKAIYKKLKELGWI